MEMKSVIIERQLHPRKLIAITKGDREEKECYHYISDNIVVGSKLKDVLNF